MLKINYTCPSWQAFVKFVGLIFVEFRYVLHVFLVIFVAAFDLVLFVSRFSFHACLVFLVFAVLFLIDLHFPISFALNVIGFY